MMHYYVTTGEVKHSYDKDDNIEGGHVIHSNGSIYLKKLIPEYYEPGNAFIIDRWGRPWVRR